MSRNEIRIAGAGGQGIVTAGRILAEAAILSGQSATQTQVYGPQSRGGASRSDVVIANGEIGFPLADDIGYLVILSAEAFSRYQPEAGAGCRLVIDSRCAPATLNGHFDSFPLADTARAISGGHLITGVIALGVLQAMAAFVDEAALRQAIGSRVSARHLAVNLEALEAGMQMTNGVPT